MQILELICYKRRTNSQSSWWRVNKLKSKSTIQISWSPVEQWESKNCSKSRTSLTVFVSEQITDCSKSRTSLTVFVSEQITGILTLQLRQTGNSLCWWNSLLSPASWNVIPFSLRNLSPTPYSTVLLWRKWTFFLTIAFLIVNYILS